MTTRRTLARGTGPGWPLGLIVVCPGSLLHALSHEPSAAEERDIRAVGPSQDQHLGVELRVVSGREVQVWFTVFARVFHGLMIATRRRFCVPHVSHLFLGHLSYENGSFPDPMVLPSFRLWCGKLAAGKNLG